jgi:uncharacterized protein
MVTACLLPCSLRRLALSLWLACGLMLITYPVLAFDPPKFQSDVLDEAGLLAESDRAVLRERIRTLRESDDIWGAVYVAKDLQQASIEEAAVSVFEKWKLGQKGKDNGVLVLIAPSERKMRIEVGYGLEGTLTDALSRRIIDEVYAPAFREKRYVDGLIQGFEVMAQSKRGETAFPEPAPAPAEQEIDWGGAGTRFFLSVLANLLPVGFYAGALQYGRQRRRVRKSANDEDVRTPFFIYLFFGVFFGLFYAVFGAAFADDPDAMLGLMWGNALFAGIFGIAYVLKAIRFLTGVAIFGGRGRSSTSNPGSGLEDNRRSSAFSSSSSSSSDSDSSSSSDGGSSGGGGSSGDW